MLQTRSGNTEKPDETWSDWSANYTDQKGAQVSSPKALYLQWRAVLKGSNAASLNEVNVSYLGRNIAPEVLSIEILPTNIGLLPNPPIQLDPNIEDFRTEFDRFRHCRIAQIPPRKVFLRGARSLQWTGRRPQWRYARICNLLSARSSETNFKLLKDKLNDNFYAVDGTALADGRYIFKIVANDSLSNPVSQDTFGRKNKRTG